MGLKRLLLITICFLGIKQEIKACGYYPMAEDLRYNFLKPNQVFPNSGDYFHYTMDLYYYPSDEENISGMFEENCVLWMNALNDKFIFDDVYYAIYKSSVLELKDKNSSNAVIKALQTPAYAAHLKYLLFAKSISNLNSSDYEFSWEYDEKLSKKKNALRNTAMKKAMKLAKSESNPELKRRYAHLAIRLAYYNQSAEKVKEIYTSFFNADKCVDVIDYYALYFKLGMEDQTVNNILKYCTVFLNSAEKRPAIGQLLEYTFNYEETLNIATTDEEKIAVNYYAACRDKFSANDKISAIADLDPSHPCLDFLIVRELNKLEHKTLTTYYLNYEGILYEYVNHNQDEVMANLQSVITDYCDYAESLYELMNSISSKRKTNLTWWPLMKDYAQLLSRADKMDTEQLLTNSKSSNLTAEQRIFAETMYVLAVFIQDEDPTLANKNVQELLLKAPVGKNNKLLIAIAKELEKHDHFNAAALVFSNVNSREFDSYDYTSWRSDKLTNTVGNDYYSDYFQYLDATASLFQIQQLIQFSEKLKLNTEFEKHFNQELAKNYNRFYDMLGTRFMRKGDLKSAYSALMKVTPETWTSDQYAYANYISDDPFNNDFYWKADFRHYKELSKKYTKPEIVKELMSLISEVNTSTGNKKAKAAYKVANCYRNMSYYGNAWMMRRYYWSVYPTKEGFEDDEEYYGCLEAQKYYHIAYENASTEQFKVLALRMEGICKKYEMIALMDSYYLDYEEEMALEKLNPVFAKLRSDYKGYEYTIANCSGFQIMYNSIDQKGNQ